MEIKAALEILEAERKYAEENAPIVERSFKLKESKTRRRAEALKIAVDTMRKEIPFTPEPYRGWEGKCKCGAVFADRLTRYCGNCGQKLDWEGAEGGYSGRL